MNILVIGSSIAEQWASAKEAFPGCTVVNVAVGGTQTSYWLSHFKPHLDGGDYDAVAYYCGSNDFNNGVPKETIVKNTSDILTMAHDQGLSFIYLAIIKAPQKMGSFDVIDHVNSEIGKRLGKRDRYVDFNDLLCPDLTDVAGLYADDDLHLTEEAYSRMAVHCRMTVHLNSAETDG